ncbi:hypothetical protein GQ55_6G145600 [Panicum hallii var. hallii]|uniref:Uncharacterized protein n=1 Tax=Panicum hallii var. hallii TaxID=1504633 RepID=A0A2T7D688_9POAL|nr:hypothetical protein GQ55_6G145600 [Panicum hallii var. hallii]PUZ51089.1 hypothetical protein GQ55_6G145600 [Panicum hallii var. hallii]
MYLRLKHGCILIEERYKEKALELNGPEFDWLHSPVDVKALYQCSYGRPHSKWTIFNGIINDGEALPELKKSRASVAKRQRQLEEERARKEAYESRLAKEYAQRMFDWGKIVLNHNDSMQKFMECGCAHWNACFSGSSSPASSTFTSSICFNISNSISSKCCCYA